jgi:uncharacterized protein (TIGR02594 family)
MRSSRPDVEGEESGMADTDKVQPGDPPWLRTAFEFLGEREIPGPVINPDLKAVVASTPGAIDDDIPWCSSFVNFCIEEAGLQGTNNRSARSWLGWGTSTNTPVRGCIVVFKRGAEGSGQGHVGLYLSGSPKTGIRIIGGNQSDKVSIVTQNLPFLGYRLAPDQGGLSMADVDDILNKLELLRVGDKAGKFDAHDFASLEGVALKLDDARADINWLKQSVKAIAAATGAKLPAEG